MADLDVYDYTLKIDKAGFARIYNAEVELDRPEESVGYLLVGILSCMGLTCRSILEKMKIEYGKIVMNGKVHMVDDNIRYGNRIECKLSLEGGPELEADVKTRIAQLTKKYCTVSVTIDRHPEITLVME